MEKNTSWLVAQNIYYNPEKFGLETVAEIEYADELDGYDTRVVWKNKSGDMFTARDSGCSCPIPFEDYNRGNIDKLDLQALRREVNEELGYGHISPERAQEFIARVMGAGR